MQMRASRMPACRLQIRDDVAVLHGVFRDGSGIGDGARRRTRHVELFKKFGISPVSLNPNEFLSADSRRFFPIRRKYSEAHTEKRAELNRNEEIRRRQAGLVRKRRMDFQEALTVAFSAIDERRPEIELEKIISTAKREVDRTIAQKIPVSQKAMALMRIEKQGRDSIASSRRGIPVTRPRVSLSRDLSNEWTSYVGQMDRLEAECLQLRKRN